MRDAVDRFQQRQFDKILPLDEPANRRRRGHHDQGIADLGIDQSVHRPGLASATVTLASAGSAMFRVAVSGWVGACILSAKVTVQLVTSPSELVASGRHLRTAEPNAHRLALVERQQGGVGDDGAVAAADRGEIERRRGVEYQPDRVGAAEQRRRCGRGEGKRQMQPVAVALDPNRRGVANGSGLSRQHRRCDPGRRLYRQFGRFADRR